MSVLFATCDVLFQPTPLESATEEQMKIFNDHQTKVKNIFIRQLSVPLLGD